MNQETALKLLKSGYNIFITGSAGTGKTYLLRQYINYLKERRVIPTIVAPTGIAASHLNGQTLHSFFGLGIRENIDNAFIESLLDKKYLKQRFDKLSVLIIDEISMVSPEQFSAMDRITQAFKNSPEPFGGVQVIASGDFFQLPPVSREAKEKRFSWQSNSWRDLDFKTCYLEQKFRQEDDQLIAILDDIRAGNISESSYQKLQERQFKELNSEFQTTKLYTHNIDVDRINNVELEKLPEALKTFSHVSKGNSKNIEKIFNRSLVLETLLLKKSAVVIFIKNNPEKNYVNGTTGVVVDFDKSNGNPIVLTNSGKRIWVGLEEWAMENDKGETIATVSQIPLRLAWAITIHKSQGMTLDSAEIDLSRTFEVGQGYVALSRLKNIEGLKLIGFNNMALSVDALILKIDGRIKEASVRAKKEIEDFNDNSLEKLFCQNILRKGGTVNQEEIEEEKKQLLSGKNSIKEKVPTHIQTKNLMENSKTISEMAKKRGMTEGTIINHLIKLKEIEPTLDLEKFNEKSNNFDAIVSAIDKIKNRKVEEDFNDKGEVRLKPVFDALNSQVSYDEIRLAMLFL